MKRSLKIGILGTRGIPNRYGGFEQCAEYLALGLTARGHQVWVYNSHSHEYQGHEWNGVHIIHCKDPEDKMGTAGQFVYDLNCINDARKRRFDVLLQLGYTSNSVWYWRWPSYCRNIINMDGLEWKRTKYSSKVQWFLKHAERWAAKHGDVLVADSTGIQQYLKATYGKDSHFIAYGAEIFDRPDESVIGKYGLLPNGYYMLMARMEPENNIELIIKGYLESGARKPLLVVGKTGNAFGSYLVDTYGSNENVMFAGGIYDTVAVNNLRYFSHLYFHGHTVGGTNPSLLEAMGSNALIAAHDNVFNKAVLGDDAFYFKSEQDISAIINNSANKADSILFIEHNLRKIREQYNWERITDQYEALMLDAVR
jgi:glycosyltransferase involved in cell wall biosynthesis